MGVAVAIFRLSFNDNFLLAFASKFVIPWVHLITSVFRTVLKVFRKYF